jgi:hypothetical protein
MICSNLVELKELFSTLLTIVDNSDDSDALKWRDTIAGVLDIIEDEARGYDNQFAAIQQIYNELYADKTGISDLYIWKNNFQERTETNAALVRVKLKLAEIFK